MSPSPGKFFAGDLKPACGALIPLHRDQVLGEFLVLTEKFCHSNSVSVFSGEVHHAINGNHRPNDSSTTQSHHICTAQTVPRTKQIACCLSLRLRSPSHFSCSLQRAMVLRLQPGKLCRWSKAFRHWQRRVTWTTKERGSGTERPVRASQLSYYMEAWRAA